MTDLEPILALWRELEAAGADYVLATVVAVEGSSYRRPGAHMLLARDGRRAGTVSGGCLEADVTRRAWWLTESGPMVESFSTLEDDGDRPYGSGCGGVVHLLLERRATAALLLSALDAAFVDRMPIAVATVLDGAQPGKRGIAGVRGHGLAAGDDDLGRALVELSESAFDAPAQSERLLRLDGAAVRVWIDYQAARPGLWIFGAGDDAKPLVRLARELGWFAGVADGRSHLVTRDRFSAANEVTVLDIAAVPGAGFGPIDARESDAAVVMTHSFEQDSRVLASLLSLDRPPAYIGALGPQRRTRELLAEAARLLGRTADDAQIERWLAAIHAPTGLDLGADTPASIALSILAQIQQKLRGGTGMPLSVVRTTRFEIAGQ